MGYTGINKSVLDKLPKQEVELSSEKVELGKVDDLLNWSKGGDTDPFDELSQLNKLSEKLQSDLYKKLEQVENKEGEADKMERMAKELGADVAEDKIKAAKKLLEGKKRNILGVIKILQRATQSKI